MNRLRMIRNMIAFAIAGMPAASGFAASVSDIQEMWRCSAPNGSGDGRAFMIPSDTTAVRGEITFHSADIKSGWASIAKLLVHQHGAHFDDDDCGCNGITIYARKTPNQIDFHATTGNADIPVADFPYEKPIPFMISISEDGTMTVTAGQTNPVTKSIKLRHMERNSIEMSCSGADVSFYDIAPL